MKALRKRWKKWLGKVKRRNTIRKKKRQENRKKREVSKMLAAWAAIMATLSVAASYTLSALGADSVSDVTVAVFTGCIAFLVTYAGKSLGEKMSRNKHGLDADGHPLSPPDDEAPEEPGASGEADI